MEQTVLNSLHCVLQSSQQRRGTTHVEVPILKLVTKGTLGDLSEPQFCHLEDGNSFYFIEL